MQTQRVRRWLPQNPTAEPSSLHDDADQARHFHLKLTFKQNRNYMRITIREMDVELKFQELYNDKNPGPSQAVLGLVSLPVKPWRL